MFGCMHQTINDGWRTFVRTTSLLISNKLLLFVMYVLYDMCVRFDCVSLIATRRSTAYLGKDTSGGRGGCGRDYPYL